MIAEHAGDAAHGVAHSVALDRYAESVRRRLDVPVALVSLVDDDADRQEFPGLAGTLPAPWGPERQTPLSHSFCRYVVHDRRPLVIPDARRDPRLHDNPAISALGVVAYAGYPLTDADGTVVGSLCAIDHRPREWTRRELRDLAALADRCSEELRRTGAAEQLDVPFDTPELAERSRLLLSLSEALAETVDVLEVADAVALESRRQLGCLRSGLWLRQTALPREVAGLADGIEADPDRLCWVRHDDAGWLQAVAYERLVLDDSTPVGTAALASESLFFESRDAQNACYPHLQHARQEGERRAFLPLISRGRLLGTLALVWPEPGPISAEQVRTVTALASYTAQALERATLRQDRADALLTLQRSLMPSLPTTDEVQLAARYLPASDEDQVGGDWYDALVPGDGRVELMIGDVMGHDISAAATMGQFRTMLRVLASTVDDGPAVQVGRLDRMIVDHDVAGMATLVNARLTRESAADAASWELVWSNAGHVPPLALLPSGEVRTLGSRTPDLFVGVMPERPRHENRETLPHGATLLLYTDGLVERRGEPLDQGLARLAAAVARCSRGSLESLLDELVATMLPDRRDDDVAVLAVRLAPPDRLDEPVGPPASPLAT